MSSILEALEKAGEERIRATARDSSRRARGKPAVRRLSFRLILVLVVGLLLLNLAIWWFYLHPGSVETQPPAAAPTKLDGQAPLPAAPREASSQPVVEKAVLSLREQLMRNTAPSAKPLSDEAQVISTPPLSREPQAQVSNEMAGQVPQSPGAVPTAVASLPTSADPGRGAPAAARPEPTPEPGVAPPREAAGGSVEGSPSQEKIPLVWELPQTLREKVLRLKSSVHVYHKLAEQRFVIIDMHRYGEGDSLPPDGFRLQRIDRDGVVIDYGQGLVRLPRR
ncbi:MAG: general secretion pathway protein GspB [Candidatus Thiodiazotropha sp.]